MTNWIEKLKAIPFTIASLYEILRDKFNKRHGRSMQDNKNTKYC